MAIDTLAYAKRLEAAGVNREQAEAHAESMNRYVPPDLATKQELAALKSDLVAELHRVEIRALGVIAGMVGLVLAVIKLT